MNILVYLDEGVGPLSFKQTVNGLREILAPFPFTIKHIHHKNLIQEEWETHTALLVFPGGRDIPYHTLLQGKANQRISTFVENGGSYLGLCAGAYYASAVVEFEKGYPLEVCSARELAFFPGKAVGPAYGLNTFCYHSEKGSRAADIEWVENRDSFKILPEMPGRSTIYYNGGCYFANVQEYPSVTVLARYADIPNRPAAAVHCRVGKGQAVLCGVHPEYQAKALNSQDPFSCQFYTLLQQKEKTRQDFWRSLVFLALTQFL